MCVCKGVGGWGSGGWMGYKWVGVFPQIPCQFRHGYSIGVLARSGKGDNSPKLNINICDRV